MELHQLRSLFTESGLGLWWDDDGHPRLRNNQPFSSPSATANYIQMVHGGQVAVIRPEQYTPKAKDLFSRNGHYFVILEERFLVDPWSAWYSCINDDAVFDLKMPVALSYCINLYGHQKTWRRQGKDHSVLPSMS